MSKFKAFSEMVANDLGIPLETGDSFLKYYSGIGSRKTPLIILQEMTKLAATLEEDGWILRSGGATGADSAFERGTSKSEIWYPDNSYSNNNPNHRVLDYDDVDAFNSIEKYHPAPHRLIPYAKLLMARNYRQIVGVDGINSSFVVCWTSDGGASGGTGQAIRIANDFGIPVFNYYNMTTEEILTEIRKLELLG